jgi:hypothetical protein
MDRRSFLKAAAAAPCVFGLRHLLGQDPAPAGPDWYRDALARMKERDLYGVVLVAPDGAKEKLELGKKLWDLLEGASSETHELFLTGVFVVMNPELALKAGVRTAEEKEDRFLLDPDGRRVSADRVGAKVFDTPDAFVADFDPFLHGEGAIHLRWRANGAGAKAPPEIFTALSDLGADDIVIRDRASAALLKRADEFLPLFAWKRRTAKDAEVAARLKTLVEQHYKSLRMEPFGPRLPFGTRVPQFRTAGCGELREVGDDEKEDSGSMVACGMGRIGEPKVRMFLRFLTK